VKRIKLWASAFAAATVFVSACSNDSGPAAEAEQGAGGDADKPVVGPLAGRPNHSTMTGGEAGQASGGMTPENPNEPGSGGAGGTRNDASEGGEAGNAASGAAGSPATLDPECDYLEGSDLTNGEYPQEQTGLSLDDSLVICGQIDVGHHDLSTVDEDGFYYLVPSPGEYVVTVELDRSNYPGVVQVAAFAAMSAGQSRYAAASGGKAGVWGRHETTGTAVVQLAAYDDVDELDVPIRYKIRILRRDWTTDCPPVTPQAAAQAYDESVDGPDGVGNDIIRLDTTSAAQTPTAADDQVELTRIVLADGEHSLIEGSSANVTHGVEEYRDGDMYRLRSGDIDRLTLRLDWASPSADLDYYLFEENSYRYIESAVTTEDPEILSLFIQPNKNYWLWVGGYQDSSSSALPRAYRVTLCGSHLEY